MKTITIIADNAKQAKQIAARLYPAKWTFVKKINGLHIKLGNTYLTLPNKTMNVKTANTHIFDIEELACKIIGLDYDEIDADTALIEEKLMDELTIDLDQFQSIVNRLLPLIMVSDSPLTEKKYKGFADIEKSTWLTKIEV